jgi:hypothetical protein
MATLLKVLNNLADTRSAGGVALCVSTQGRLVADGGARGLAANSALQAHGAHQSLDCSASIWMRVRIASSELILIYDPLPHVICSRPMVIGGVSDEADQHGDA